MIEGRPRESLVQYENPIEVYINIITHIYCFRYQQAKMLMIHLKRVLEVIYL